MITLGRPAPTVDAVGVEAEVAVSPGYPGMPAVGGTAGVVDPSTMLRLLSSVRTLVQCAGGREVAEGVGTGGGDACRHSRPPIHLLGKRTHTGC